VARSRGLVDVGQGGAPLLTWLAALLVSCTLAWVMNSALDTAAASADNARLTSEHCSAGGRGLLYVGLNSWIPLGIGCRSGDSNPDGSTPTTP
jgi:hypothetical protein